MSLLSQDASAEAVGFDQTTDSIREAQTDAARSDTPAPGQPIIACGSTSDLEERSQSTTSTSYESAIWAGVKSDLLGEWDPPIPGSAFVFHLRDIVGIRLGEYKRHEREARQAKIDNRSPSPLKTVQVPDDSVAEAKPVAGSITATYTSRIQALRREGSSAGKVVSSSAADPFAEFDDDTGPNVASVAWSSECSGGERAVAPTPRTPESASSDASVKTVIAPVPTRQKQTRPDGFLAMPMPPVRHVVSTETQTYDTCLLDSLVTDKSGYEPRTEDRQGWPGNIGQYLDDGQDMIVSSDVSEYGTAVSYQNVEPRKDLNEWPTRDIASASREALEAVEPRIEILPTEQNDSELIHSTMALGKATRVISRRRADQETIATLEARVKQLERNSLADAIRLSHLDAEHQLLKREHRAMSRDLELHRTVMSWLSQQPAPVARPAKSRKAKRASMPVKVEPRQAEQTVEQRARRATTVAINFDDDAADAQFELELLQKRFRELEFAHAQSERRRCWLESALLPASSGPIPWPPAAADDRQAHCL